VRKIELEIDELVGYGLEGDRVAKHGSAKIGGKGGSMATETPDEREAERAKTSA
jgi:hypothetical protein